MVRVVGVRFKRAGKVYYFDPGDLEPVKGGKVIVETARGIELGEVVSPVKEVAEEELTSPLKRVIRLATAADEVQLKENQAREKEAFTIAERKIAEHGLEMDLVDVEYTFDGSKIIFYFTAEGRVDFRELVRDLAGVFRTRIELRQIGVRDEAKMLGGIGPCGRALCCATFLGDFAPVSIKMAKEQNLSLNPTKISGLCGRLLCCLRYESEHYERAKAAFPPVGTPVATADGEGKVAAINVIKGTISVEFPTGATHDYQADAVRPLDASGPHQRADAAGRSEELRSDGVPAADSAAGTAEGPAGEAGADQAESEAGGTLPPCPGCAAGCPLGEAGARADAEAEAALPEEDVVAAAEGAAADGEEAAPTLHDLEPLRPASAGAPAKAPNGGGSGRQTDNPRHRPGVRRRGRAAARGARPGEKGQRAQTGGGRPAPPGAITDRGDRAQGGGHGRRNRRHYGGGGRPRGGERPGQ